MQINEALLLLLVFLGKQCNTVHLKKKKKRKNTNLMKKMISKTNHEEKNIRLRVGSYFAI